MPVPGARQKPPGQAVTRHKPVTEWTEVPKIPFTKGPRLPPTRRNGKPWHPACRDKWNAWRAMPHCVLWDATDWQYALDSIEVAATMMSESHDPRRSAELRNREKVMGTTFEYRREIRVRYIDPPVEAPVEVARLDDYRAL